MSALWNRGMVSVTVVRREGRSVRINDPKITHSGGYEAGLITQLHDLGLNSILHMEPPRDLRHAIVETG